MEERRVVTVLFADLVGYTTLAEYLDPERVKRLVEACFERLVADIEQFGGRVDKLLGDAIVALFGAPVAHEDDAERAVRAALRMQSTLARFVDEVGADPPIQMRIGINTGEVLVGTLAGSDYTAMGDVVNTAARLQSLAPTGGVLIGSATAALCSSTVRREPLADTRIRGREQPEQSWLVTGAVGSGEPARAAATCPFVGRHHERALLDAAVQLVRDGRSGIISIVGEAGAGKSRLADEIVELLEDEAIVIRTACAPYGETNSLAPVINGLSALLALDPEATAADIEAAIRARSFELWGLDADDEAVRRYIDTVSFLLGHPSPLDRLDPATARDAVAGTLTDMLRRDAQTRMTVLWVDNLQWAEPRLRDQLAVLVRTLSELPFLLITASDPIPMPPGRRWSSDRSCCRCRSARCSSTRRAPSCATSSSVAMPPPAIWRWPSSSPEAAATRCSSSSWPVWPRSCGSGSELPGSLRALIAARLDQLPAAAAGVDRQRCRARYRQRHRLARALRQGAPSGVPPRRSRRVGRRRVDRHRGPLVAVPQRRGA